MLDVEKVKLDSLKKMANDLGEKLEQVEMELADDPLMTIINTNIEFSDLLKATEGNDRHTPQFDAKVKALHNKEKAAKRRAESYDLVKLLDTKNHLSMEIGTLKQEINLMEFRNKLKGK